MTRISLNIENRSLEYTLKTIEDESEFFFLYNKDLIDVEQEVSIHASNQTIKSILDQLTEGKNINYAVYDKQIVLVNKQISDRQQDQRKSISGQIKDDTGQPITGVTVLQKGTTHGTVSDAEGNFSLADLPDNATLVFSFVGMKTKEITVGEQSILNIVMEVDAIGIDEVVAVGYGIQKKINVTGSVQSISSEKITQRSLANTSSALQGLAPGVSVVQTSGKPGSDGAQIMIRGVGSLNSSTSPLVLIDGVEGNMDQIDMNTIESISILKDAASASIYGSKASNGVILITTKRAKGDQVKVSYNAFVGLNTPTELPDPVDAIGYMEQINIAKTNSDESPQYSEELINQYKTVGADNFTTFNTNWKNLVIKDNALTHNHSLSMSGGTGKVSFFANAGYYYQDGQIANNEYQRKTLRLNSDAAITKWMKVGVDLNLSQAETTQPSIEDPVSTISKALTFTPVFSGLNDDGTYGYGQNGDNPLATSEVGGISKTIAPEVGIRGFVEINPLNGLMISSSYSTQKIESKVDRFISPYDTYEGGAYKTTYPASGNMKYEGLSQVILNQFNVQAYYEKSIKDNYFKVLGGIQTEERLGHSFYASRMGYNYEGFEELNHGDITTSANGGTSYEWAMFSYFGRLNYNYKERYLVELNGRWDASSRFMEDYRLGFFPSASIGWRVSEEPFMQSVNKTIGNLKIRASYGTMGNQDISGYYPYATTLSPGYGYWFNEQLGTGVAQTQSANQMITWEKSTQANIGIDASVLNNKLGITFDYFVRNINDMLQQFPIPIFVGLSSPWENAGSMKNVGWEIALTWSDQINDFKYSVTGYLSDVKNTVTNLYGNEYISDRITTEGEAIGSWYGYVAEGYFQNQEEIDASPVYGEKQNVKPGYVKYSDLSGPDNVPDGIIDSYDRTIIGSPLPHYEYSLNISGEWKNFDLSMFFQGVGKKDIFYSGNGARPFYIGRTIYKNQLDYWTEDNRDAKFPILLIDGSGNNPNNIISTQWVKSGAYMRLKNLVIGYSLPKQMLQKIKMDKLRIYASGQNLFTLSNAYKGYDPELSVSNGNFYPVMRTLTLGLDIRF
ncbi:MAG: TonB-dependent receptor [Bacteroidales bacterium]|nr:TonB-dependent receptor [Bacteroidales bacterium]